MADAVIQFPGIRSESSTQGDQTSDAALTRKLVDIIQKRPEKDDPTTAYQTLMVNAVPYPIKTTTDLMDGSQRNPHWGFVLGFNIIPDLSKSAPGPVMLPSTTPMFITADSLEALKERVIFEIEKAIEIAQFAKDNPDVYDKFQDDLASGKLTQ